MNGCDKCGEYTITFTGPSARTETYTVYADNPKQALEIAQVKRKVDKAFS